MSTSRTKHFKHSLPWLRLSLLLLCAWLLVDLARPKTQARLPLAELQQFVPSCTQWEQGKTASIYLLQDKHQNTVGTARRTLPRSLHIRGYAGPLDALLLFDLKEQCLGYILLDHFDTPTHIEMMEEDLMFKETWANFDRDSLANAKHPEDLDIWGVSGATKSSMGLSWSLLLAAKNEATIIKNTPVPSVFTWKILLQTGLIIWAIWMLFSRRLQTSPHWRRVHYALMIILYGLVLGDLFSLSSFFGLIRSPQHAWGVWIILAPALLIPVLTRKPWYCQSFCPQGLVQDWLAQNIPRRFHLKISRNVREGLTWIPPLLLIFCALSVLFRLPLNVGELEVFQAWNIHSKAPWPLIFLGGSLLVSAIIPHAYCKYACPTGCLLKLCRSRGTAEKLGRAELILLITAVALLLLKFNSFNLNTWVRNL